MLLLSSMAKIQGNTLDIMVWRINGMRNTVIGDEPPSPEFECLIELYSQLRQGDTVYISVSTKKEDATDTRSKRAFQLFRIFINLRLKDVGRTQRAPIPTVPIK